MRICRLSINHFRGLDDFTWAPQPGLNCLVGPADSGKSTILAAINLLLTPLTYPGCTDFDFYKRRTEAGFTIEAVIAGIEPGLLGRVPALHGWKDGALLNHPDEGGAEPVLVVRLVGSPDLELTYSIVHPSNELAPFSAKVRQQLPVARLTAWEYGTRELRLGRASLLNKSIQGYDLKSTIHEAAANATSNLQLPQPILTRLDELRTEFRKAGLPDELHLGLISPPDSTLSAMFGLMVGSEPSEAIPLAYAGTGTKYNSLFTLMATLAGTSGPLVLIDEPEVGLEPYRQRGLIARLRRIIGETGQAFLTTHSSAVLLALSAAELWRKGPGTLPTSLNRHKINTIRERAPDALISALPVLAEGATEAGLLSVLLNEEARKAGLPDIETLGMRIIEGKGQPHVLNEATDLLESGFQIGLFVDEECEHSGKRADLAANPKCVCRTWGDSTLPNIEAMLTAHLPWDHLQNLIGFSATLPSSRGEKALLDQVGHAIGIPGSQDIAVLRDSTDEARVRSAVCRAMNTGGWFKRYEDAEALGGWLLKNGAPEPISTVIQTFWQELIARL